MPSCSVHHCVLFLLTLTLTTDPGAATEFPIYVKLHQPGILPCGAQCSGRAKWSLDSKRDVVFARCDQTSCTSVQQGYEMSHDKFKRGDLSLTITNPDYSMRKTYTCECDYSDYATVRLRISPVSSAVQMRPGEDLKLDLSVPESVEVIYRRSDSADGVQICNVTHGTLQCNTEYRPRTSLSHSELTLRDLWPWESGTYTIRNLDYKEDIRVYAVSVSAVSSAVPVQTEGDLKLDLSVPESVEVIYRGSDSADGVQICNVTDRTLECNTEYTPRTSLSHSELTVRNMKRSESGTYTIRDTENNRDIRVYAVSVSGLTSGETAGIVIPVLLLMAGLVIAGVWMYRKKAAEWEVKSDMEAVNDLMAQAKLKPRGEQMAALQQVEEKIKALEQKYRGDSEYKELIRLFCKRKREEMEEISKKLAVVQTGEVKSAMLAVYKDINETLRRAAVEEAELQRVEKKIKDLEKKYRDDREHYGSVMMFCNSKREYLRLYREVFTPKNTSLQSVTQEVKTVMNEVDEIIKEAELKPGGEQEEVMQEVLQKITDLQLKYRWARECNVDVAWFCDTKKKELECCRVFYAKKSTELQIKEVEKEMDAVDALIQKVLHTPPGEQEEEEVLDKAHEKINEVLKKYLVLVAYCDNKRKELGLCRRINVTQIQTQQPGTGEMTNEMEAVYAVIRQYKHRPTLEVKKTIDDLEQKCRVYRDYYSSVGMFWNQKRTDLEVCSKLGLLKLEFNWTNTEKEMENVVKTFDELKLIAAQNPTISPELMYHMYMHVNPTLERISAWCRERRDNLKTFKQQPSRGERDDRMIRDVERHLRGLEQWYMDKEYELEKYLKKQGEETSDVEPQTSRSEGGEDTALLEV